MSPESGSEQFTNQQQSSSPQEQDDLENFLKQLGNNNSYDEQPNSFEDFLKEHQAKHNENPNEIGEGDDLIFDGGTASTQVQYEGQFEDDEDRKFFEQLARDFAEKRRVENEREGELRE